jgi:hypothetical protein
MARPKYYDDSNLFDGQVIKTIWNDNEYELTVVKDSEGCRFKVRGKTFGSLSRAARSITGSYVSGPQFWGLIAKTVHRR